MLNIINFIWDIYPAMFGYSWPVFAVVALLFTIIHYGCTIDYFITEGSAEEIDYKNMGIDTMNPVMSVILVFLTQGFAFVCALVWPLTYTYILLVIAPTYWVVRAQEKHEVMETLRGKKE